jgi:Flp pilus assembly protein TadD
MLGTLRLAAIVASVALCGCAALPVTPAARAVAGDLVAIPAQGGLSLHEAGIATLDERMRRFVASELTATSDAARLAQLVGAVIRNPSFHVDYGDQTRTAIETFETLRGNCLAFTNLFVALAREAGLEIAYQEVDVPPTWSLRGDTFVVSRHINAIASVSGQPEYVVDFNMPEFRAAYPRRAISDQRAAAHYYSNLGVERMQAGEPEAALAYFQKSLAMDHTLPQAWINLGVWHRRRGDFARAEASYVEALRLAPRDYVAMNNLASLHAQADRPDLSRLFAERIKQHRARNPYFKYAEAEAAFRRGDYRLAQRRVREAIRGNDVDATFFSLLGRTQRQLGDDAAARQAFARALEISDDPNLRTAMRRKLELLGEADGGL